MLIYPTLGPAVLTDSSHTYAQGYFLDVDHLRYDYGQYLAGYADATDPRVSPLMAEDLSGSPPAILVLAECDPLRDEGLAYAGLLEHFGVPVELLEAKGMPHGFLRMGGRRARGARGRRRPRGAPAIASSGPSRERPLRHAGPVPRRHASARPATRS